MAPTKTPAQPTPTPTQNPAPAEPEQATTKKTSGLAIAALILAFFIPIVGFILGIVALSSIKKNKEGGHGIAIAAIIISVVIMLLSLLAIFGFVIAVNKAAKDSGVSVNGSSVSVTNKDGESASFGNDVSLPSGFPSDVPIYEPSQTKGALKTGQDAYSAVLATDDSFTKVDDFYKSQLASKGWKSGEGTGEFSSDNGKLATYVKGDRTLGVLIATSTTGGKTQTSVTLTVGPTKGSSSSE